MIIAPEVLVKLEQANVGLKHGVISLSIHVRDGQPRYKFAYEEWIIIGDDQPTRNDSLAKDETERHKRKIIIRKPRAILRYYIPFAT